MSTKHIFIFTICIALSHGLYTTTTDSGVRALNNDEVIGHWYKENPFISNKEGHTFVRVFMNCRCRQNRFYIYDKERIGISLVSYKFNIDAATKEMIVVLSKALRIPQKYITIISGFNHPFKILKFSYKKATSANIRDKITQLIRATEDYKSESEVKEIDENAETYDSY